MTTPPPQPDHEPALRIFLSYRREDAGGHAGRLYDTLAGRYGAEHVFMDIDAIPLGSDFADVISDAVVSCDVLIALIGRGWLSATDAAGRRRLDNPDDYVRREIEAALARGVPVVPACVQAAEIPAARDLPPSLAPLVERQGINLQDEGWPDDVARLVRRLDAVRVGAPTRQAPPTPPARKRRADVLPLVPDRRVGALIALAALVTALAVLLGQGDEPPSPKRTSTTAGAQRTAAERRLLEVIPASTRTHCERSSEREPGATASLSCGVGSALTANYSLFPDAAALTGWYLQKRSEEGVADERGNCTPADFHGEGAYQASGGTIGRYFCRLDDDDEPLIIARDERVDVGVEATGYHGSGREAIASMLALWDCCIRVAP